MKIHVYDYEYPMDLWPQTKRKINKKMGSAAVTAVDASKFPFSFYACTLGLPLWFFTYLFCLLSQHKLSHKKLNI